LVLAGGLTRWFLTTHFGDVARYVTASPRNIQVRHSARQRGVKLLSQLALSKKYSRIIVVGHSLGSILAHDLVWWSWCEAVGGVSFSEGSALHRSVLECEHAADDLLASDGYVKGPRPAVTGCPEWLPLAPRRKDFPEKLEAYRIKQRELFRELVEETRHKHVGAPHSHPWLISDLITLGSPLTHAECLIARGRLDLLSMTRSREILRCPPVLDDEEDPDVFRFTERSSHKHWKFHHGSAMAAVRWTNIHDAAGSALFLAGDLLSGPVALNFGPGVVDVRVRMVRRRGLLRYIPRLFTHTLYWNWDATADSRGTTPDQVDVLRDAVNVLDDNSVEARLLARASALEKDWATPMADDQSSLGVISEAVANASNVRPSR
jgi:hypothetical protein